MKGNIQALAVTATYLLAVTGCAKSDAAEMPPGTAPVPVMIAPVQLASESPTITIAGTLSAKEELPLSFKIGGVVSRVSAEAGQSVAAGAVLAELALTEVAAEVEKAHQARTKAERDLVRAKSLYRDSVATLEQLQDATTAFDVAESNVRIAEFNRQYAIIRAPDAGIILKRMVEPGELVTSGTPVVRFRTTRRGLVVRAGLPDRDAVLIRTGDAATVAFDAFPGERFHGRVAQVAASATTGTGTYEVEVAIDTRGRSLASGLVGRVELKPRIVGRLPTVPVQAILEANGDSATLFRLSDDRTKAVRLRVLVGTLEGDRITVLGGIDRGAQVITAGAAWLADGTPVKVSANAAVVPPVRKVP